MAYGTVAHVQKTTVYIDPRTKRDLEALSRRTGRAQAELLREALVEYVGRHRPPALPTFVATAAVGGDAGADLEARLDRAGT
jgi:predicted transcriptional regulator